MSHEYRIAFNVLLFTGLSMASALGTPKDAVLGHVTFGKGPEKVLVFHDWMGDAANWEPVLPYLNGTDYTFVFAEVRGYGRSKHLAAEGTSAEIAADAVRLADSLGWDRFHVVGHSFTGMGMFRLLLEQHRAGSDRIKSAVVVTPVTPDGYPADKETATFLWELIGQTEGSQQAFAALTGGRLGELWPKVKTERHLATASLPAVKAYYRMWLEEDFSQDLAKAGITTPVHLIGGRQDLPGFQETYYRETIAKWLPNLEMAFITDAGHYPMHETPVYLASLIGGFLDKHR